MMTTLTIPERAPDTGDLRFVPVRVNLLPDEIVAGRRTEVLRRQVLLGLAGLAVVIVVVFGFSFWQTHSANNGLEAAQSAQTELQQQSKRYAPLVTAKSDTASIRTQLRTLLAGDIRWNELLRTVRTTAPRGVTVTQLDGSALDASSPNTQGVPGIGSLTLTGTARDKNSVADYADALSRLKGLGSAQPSNTSTADGRTSWTITVPVTSEALRSAAKTGGK